jgi:hypothetical protein
MAAMQRRTFIAGLGIPAVTVSAGCVANSPGDVTEDSRQHRISVQSVDAISDQYGLAGDVAVESGGFGGEKPPRVSISLTNQGSEAIGLETGNRPVIGEQYSTSPERLWLLEPGRADTDSMKQSEDGCWITAEPVGVTEALYKTKIVQGQRKSVSAELFADGDHFEDHCPAEDTYRFEQRYQAYRQQDESGEWTVTGEFRWGFSLRVEV